MSPLEMKIKEQILRSMAQGSNIYIGCSGGVDSMVLGHLCWKAAQEHGFKSLKVLHVNYGLRGAESDGDQDFVEEYFNHLGVSVQVLDLRSKEAPSTGIQDWARKLRFQWFNTILKEGDLVALGHHQGDVAENILFRLSRGVGDNLSGLQAFLGPYWRPMLEMSRKEILAYSHGQNVPYRNDSSNDKIIYSRNRIRHRVIPELESLFQGAERRLVDTVRDIDEVLSFVDEGLAQYLEPEGLKWQEVRGLPVAVQKRLVHLYLKINGLEGGLDRDGYEDVAQKMARGRSFAIDLSGDHKLLGERGCLRLLPKAPSRGKAQQFRNGLIQEFKALVPKGGSLSYAIGQECFAHDASSSKELLVKKTT